MGWYSCWLSGQAVGYVALKKNWKKDSNGEKAVGSKGKERKGKRAQTLALSKTARSQEYAKH
jgi:hypothetical protein